MENQIIRSLNRTNAFYNMVLPSQFGEMDLHRTKLEEMARSAVILRISTAKRHVAAGTNDLPPIMKNERYKPNNPTETRAIPARTQIAEQNSELAMIDLHRNTAT